MKITLTDHWGEPVSIESNHIATMTREPDGAGGQYTAILLTCGKGWSVKEPPPTIWSMCQGQMTSLKEAPVRVP